MFRHDYLQFLSNRLDQRTTSHSLDAMADSLPFSSVLTFGKAEHLAEHEKLMWKSCISIWVPMLPL